MQIHQEVHDESQAGHLGIEKSYRRATLTYYWPGILRDTVNWLSKDESATPGPPGLMSKRVVNFPWSVVSTDCMGAYTRSTAGNSYIVIFHDNFSKWIECNALRTTNAKKVSAAIYDLIASPCGKPDVIHTENGTEFVNKVMKLRPLGSTEFITPSTPLPPPSKAD